MTSLNLNKLSNTELLIEGNKKQKQINTFLNENTISKLNIEDIKKIYGINLEIIKIINFFEYKESNKNSFFNSLFVFLEKNNDIFGYLSESFNPTPIIFKVLFSIGIDTEEEVEKYMNQFNDTGILNLLQTKKEIEKKLEYYIKNTNFNKNNTKEIKLLIAKYLIINKEFEPDLTSKNHEIQSIFKERLKVLKEQEHTNRIDSEIKDGKRNIEGYTHNEKKILMDIKKNNLDLYNILIYKFEFNTQEEGIYINNLFLDRKDFFQSIKDVEKQLPNNVLMPSKFRNLKTEYDIPEEFLSSFYKKLHHTFGKEFLIKLFNLDPSIFGKKSNFFN